MTTLADNAVRDFELGTVNEMEVVAADTIYEGAAVGDDGAGRARPLVAGDPFRGFAETKVDNEAGAAGDKRVRLRTFGLVRLTLAAAAITDVGKPVYASDDDTFTLTASGNSYVGRVHRYIAGNDVIVAFDVGRGSLGSVDKLTDNSGGTTDGTLEAVPSDTLANNAAAANNNFAELNAKLDAILDQLA